MKLRTKYHIGENWKVFFTASITCLSIFHRSEVLAATLNIRLPQSNKTETTPFSPRSNGSRNNTSGTIIHEHPDQPEGLDEGVPMHILGQILNLDQLKCFPKLMCALYQDDAVTRQGFMVNATELALAYIKLMKAVYYTTPERRTTTTTEAPRKRKRPIIQIFKIPMGLITASTSLGRLANPFGNLHRLENTDDERERRLPYYSHHFSRSPMPFSDEDEDEDDEFDNGYHSRFDGSDEEDEDEEAREFLREKIEMSRLMHNLKDEDDEEMVRTQDTPAGGLATTLLSSFLPFVGSGSSSSRSGRYRRGVDFPRRMNQKLRDSHRRTRKGRKKKHQNPFWKAVSMWRKLKKRSQCQPLYKACPFESWEIVRMLDLVKGQSRVLSAYLKITVDKVKPKRKRH